MCVAFYYGSIHLHLLANWVWSFSYTHTRKEGHLSVIACESGRPEWGVTHSSAMNRDGTGEFVNLSKVWIQARGRVCVRVWVKGRQSKSVWVSEFILWLKSVWLLQNAVAVWLRQALPGASPHILNDWDWIWPCSSLLHLCLTCVSKCLCLWRPLKCPADHMAITWLPEKKGTQ